MEFSKFIFSLSAIHLAKLGGCHPSIPGYRRGLP